MYVPCGFRGYFRAMVHPEHWVIESSELFCQPIDRPSNPTTRKNTPMVKWLSCLPSKQAARVRFPFGVILFPFCSLGYWSDCYPLSSLKPTTTTGSTQGCRSYIVTGAFPDGHQVAPQTFLPPKTFSVTFRYAFTVKASGQTS